MTAVLTLTCSPGMCDGGGGHCISGRVDGCDGGTLFYAAMYILVFMNYKCMSEGMVGPECYGTSYLLFLALWPAINVDL